jgi:hypothetical protein
MVQNEQKQLLREAYALMQDNEKEQARDVLIEVLQQDVSVVDAYLLWAKVAEGPEDAREALQEALRYDPGNATAQKWLRKLDKRHRASQTVRQPSSGGFEIKPLAEISAAQLGAQPQQAEDNAPWDLTDAGGSPDLDALRAAEAGDPASVAAKRPGIPATTWALFGLAGVLGLVAILLVIASAFGG